MALINCPECGKEISDTARACPHCGYTENAIEIPIWEKYTLSVEEAALYFRIGVKKLRGIANDNPDADYILWNGTRPQIKRKLFEKVIDDLSAI